MKQHTAVPELLLDFERIDVGKTQLNGGPRRTALLQAAELYERTGDRPAMARIWERFVERYPEPLDEAMAARLKLADLGRDMGDPGARSRWLREIIGEVESTWADS